MRARLPAFESVRGGELALLGLAQLRRVDETLPHLLTSLHKEGVAAVGVAAPSLENLGNEALAVADQFHLPLILLPLSASLEEIEREVITFVVSFRGEIERKATEIAHQLMQLSVQGAGIQGICDHLARSSDKWVVLQDADQQVRFQSSPSGSKTPALPATLTDEALRHRDLNRIMVPVQIRHEVVGYLSLIGEGGDFDYLERLILGQVAPILALEFARERERSEVESRYSAEALMDVLQGNYQQPDEMVARARLLGYDLATPQVVVIFELAADEPGYPQGQWGKRLRDELQRTWPSCWVSSEAACRGRKSYIYTPGAGEGACAAGQRQLIRLYRRYRSSRQRSTGGTTIKSRGPASPGDRAAALRRRAAPLVRQVGHLQAAFPPLRTRGAFRLLPGDTRPPARV
jgi:purine catabolism regulator